MKGLHFTPSLLAPGTTSVGHRQSRRFDLARTRACIPLRSYVMAPTSNNIPRVRKIREPQPPHDPTHVTRNSHSASWSVCRAKPPNARSVRLIYFLYFPFKLTDHAR